jgi:hypothetical protein
LQTSKTKFQQFGIQAPIIRRKILPRSSDFKVDNSSDFSVQACNIHKENFNYGDKQLKAADVSTFNPLTAELNPSAQRCMTIFLLGIFLLESCISLIHA